MGSSKHRAAPAQAVHESDGRAHDEIQGMGMHQVMFPANEGDFHIVHLPAQHALPGRRGMACST